MLTSGSRQTLKFIAAWFYFLVYLFGKTCLFDIYTECVFMLYVSFKWTFLCKKCYCAWAKIQIWYLLHYWFKQPDKVVSGCAAWESDDGWLYRSGYSGGAFFSEVYLNIISLNLYLGPVLVRSVKNELSNVLLYVLVLGGMPCNIIICYIHVQALVAEVPEIILGCISRDEAALAVAQKVWLHSKVRYFWNYTLPYYQCATLQVFKGLYENDSNIAHVGAHLAILAAIRDVSKFLVKELTSWVWYHYCFDILLIKSVVPFDSFSSSWLYFSTK